MDQKKIPQSEAIPRFDKAIAPVLSSSKESKISGFPGFTSSANSEVSYYKYGPPETESSTTIYQTSPSSCYSSCTANSSDSFSKYYSVNSSVVSHQSPSKSTEHSDLFFCNSEVLRIKQELLELERNKRRTKRIIEQLKNQMDTEEKVLNIYSSEKCSTTSSDTLYEDSSDEDTLHSSGNSIGNSSKTMHATIDNWADTVCKENPDICQSLGMQVASNMTSQQLPVSSEMKIRNDIRIKCDTDNYPTCEDCLRDSSLCITTMEDLDYHFLDSTGIHCDSEGNENELKATSNENGSAAKITSHEEAKSEQEAAAEVNLNDNNMKKTIADESLQASKCETCGQDSDKSSVETNEIQTKKNENQTGTLTPQHKTDTRGNNVSTSNGSNCLSSSSKLSIPSHGADMKDEGEKPLMEAIIDCSSDNINTFLSGFLLSKHSREQLAHAFLKSYGTEQSKKWIKQIETFEKKAGDRSTENFRNKIVDNSNENLRKKAEGESTDAKHTIEHNNDILIEVELPGDMTQQVDQECGYDFGYVESPSFPELVGAWSGSETNIFKSLSQSSCMANAKEKAGITLSMSSNSIRNVPKEPSDTTLAIRRRLNLLSLISPTPVMPTLTKCHMNMSKGDSDGNIQQSGLEGRLNSGSRSRLKCSTAESTSSHGKSKRKRRVRRNLRSALESESSLQILANDVIIALKQQATAKTSCLNTHPETKLEKSPNTLKQQATAKTSCLNTHAEANLEKNPSALKQQAIVKKSCLNTHAETKLEKSPNQSICSTSLKGFVVKQDEPLQDESINTDVQNGNGPTFSGIWKQIGGDRVNAVTQVDSNSPLEDKNNIPTLERAPESSTKKIDCAASEGRCRPQFQKYSDNNTKSKSQSKSCSRDVPDEQKDKVKVKLLEKGNCYEKLGENTASAEQIYRDLHGHSSSRVKVGQHHLRNAVKRKLLSFTKKHSSIL